MRSTYVYHCKANEFKGDTLYPLNTLKIIHPAIYENAVKKYQGREWLMNVSIPPLNCLWNDVIHCSLMHPSLIYKSLSDIGFDHHKISRLWFEIPLSDIINLPSTLYLNNRVGQDSQHLLDLDCEAITPERIQELSEMPEYNLKYYHACFGKGTRPLLWGYAPHVLVKGELKVDKYRVIDWCS